jgi:lactose/cellobiose-specific phosphotransferase system IIC component
MNEKKSSKVFNWSLNVLEKLSNMSIFLVVQRSLAIVLPLIMVGAFGLIIRHFPFPGVHAFFEEMLGQKRLIHYDNLIAGTFGIVSLALLCTFSGVLAMTYNQKRKGPFISPVMAIVVVLSCFFIVTAPESNTAWETIFSMQHGLLPAIIISFMSCTLFLHLSRFRFMQWPLGAVGHDPIVRDVLTVMPAGVVTILCFFLLRILLYVLGISDIHDNIRSLLFLPFQGASDSLGFGFSYTSLSQIFWFFGAHGPNLLFPIETNITTPALLANASALSHGLAPELIFTRTFFDVFTRMGGSGCTLCLILAIILKSRDYGARKLCFFALIPALCNVNEPILFGIPIVLNPLYLIPFLLTPLIQTLTAYLGTLIGFVPYTSVDVNWTTPALLSGFISTDSIAGSAMQVINLMIGTCIYIPFVKLGDRLHDQQGQRMLRKLMDAAISGEANNRGIKLLDLSGEDGRFAKNLANDLVTALDKKDQIYLVYQPQISRSDLLVHGVEALLRWKHPIYGMISPPITVALAEDLGEIDRLGLFVLSQACMQRAAWKNFVDDSLCMSVNVAPRQLANPSFAGIVFSVLKENGLENKMLELELTESTVVDPDENTMADLRYLQKQGVRIAIDDFGMGHASLRYLRSLPITTVKIDRSLTIGKPGEVNDHIVRSVVELSQTLGIMTIVEGVETDEQLKRFTGIGCDVFQGYLFSRPLPSDECETFIQNRINQ